MTEIKIRSLIADDWESVRSIYLQGIASGQATFETRAPSWVEWNSGHLTAARLVATDSDQIVGWAALSPVSGRRVYAGVAEVSVYVRGEWRGRGVGKVLLRALAAESEKHTIWTLQATIFPENLHSLALHKSCGFRDVGRRRRIGEMNGVWRDTLLLERRSKLVGSD